MPDVANIELLDPAPYELPPTDVEKRFVVFIDTEVYEILNSQVQQNVFGIDYISDAQEPAAPVTYTASLVGGKIRVVFNRDVLDSILLRSPTSFVVGLPAGAGPITILHVETVPNQGLVDELFLTVNGEFVNGGAYTLTLAEGIARAYPINDCGQNELVAVPFTGVGVAPTVTGFFATNAVTVQVQFSKSVRQVNPVNADDALNPANYVITGLSVLSVASIASNLVALTTTPQVPNQSYSWTVSNIKDLAGNVVA